MPLRQIVIRAPYDEMTGDELVEVWLKTAGVWALYDTVPLDGSPPDQLFAFPNLEEGDEYSVQLRASREGRYRAGYLGGDPEGWPEQSRIDFIPGDVEAGAPTIVEAVWERTSAISERVTVTVTPNPDNLEKKLQLLRDGVVVDEVDGPHVGDVDLVDIDPPGETTVTYTARHIQLTLAGLESDPLDRWVGPDAPTALDQSGEIDDYYHYQVSWTNVAGATRVRDDWPIAGYIDRGVELAGVTSHDQNVEKESSGMEGADEVLTTCNVEIRHEVVAFAVTDVSDWVITNVSITEHTDETAH
jgi:hypothetical protein